MSRRKLIILDRDGVINQDSDGYIKTADEWFALPGSLEAIATLNKQGHYVGVASNQSGLARGLLNKTQLEAIHQKMKDELEALGAHFDHIVYCPHHPDVDCHCRKPKPGMLLDIAAHSGLSLLDAVFIGDKLSDIQAARLAGCQPILVKTGKGTKTLETHSELLEGVLVFEDLQTVVQNI